MNHPYSPLDIGSITHTNDGPSALDVRSEHSHAFARFESGVFDIYTSLIQLGHVSEHLTTHTALHTHVIAEVNEILMDLDMVKEVEWDRQKCAIYRATRHNGYAVVDTG